MIFLLLVLVNAVNYYLMKIIIFFVLSANRHFNQNDGNLQHNVTARHWSENLF